MLRATIVSELLKSASITAPDLLAADIATALSDAGCNYLVLFVVDYEQETLQPVALASELLDDPPEGAAIVGTMAGRAYQRQEILSTQTDSGWRVWVPVHERAERIGTLELGFAQVDQEILDLCEDLGCLVGHLVHSAGRYTDLIELRRRRRPMNLAAEVQWDMLLPPLAFRSPEVAVAGQLEPAYNVGGDGFDYSLNGDLFSFAIFDSMGHGLQSTLATTLATAAFRYGRRRGLELSAIAAGIDDAVVSQFSDDMLVTGHIAQLDTGTGKFSWVNAGHPDPLLVRGAAVVSEPHCEPCLPFGFGIKIVEVGHCELEPEDRLFFYSDGVVEARPGGVDQFGLERLRGLLEHHTAKGLVPAEILRRIIGDVRAHRGAELEDDATIVVLEWRPAH